MTPRTAEDPHALSLDYYSLEDLERLVDREPPLELGAAAAEKIRAGAEFVQAKAREDRYIYGVNTGFGALCETRIRPDEVERLQYNHVVSHACGVGELVDERTTRLMMLIKLLTFRGGNTGVSIPTVERLIELWNHGVLPAVPRRGTVGATGDLAPLAHLALPLLGLGQVRYGGRVVPSAQVLAEKGWEPLRLAAKDGLALTNGVQYLNAVATELLLEIRDLVRCADLLAALSTQAFSGSETFYDPLYHGTSHHEERRQVARNLSRLLEGSNHWRLPTANRSKQDPYSFRCTPQVHAAVRQTVGFAVDIVERECNSVSDNPLFFPEEDRILFGGNLHGESTAMVLDFLAIAVTELSNISERRTYQLLSGCRGLPDFLVKNAGLNSGFMIVQYTSAALLNESKVLSTPASVDTIPTCQLQEDHVSMGGTSAHKLQQIVLNCRRIMAYELLIAAQAVEMNPGLELSPVTREVHGEFRGVVDFLENDRVMHDDMVAAEGYLARNRRRFGRELGLE